MRKIAMNICCRMMFISKLKEYLAILMLRLFAVYWKENEISFLFFFLAVGEWLLLLPRPTSLTAGFAQPLRHTWYSQGKFLTNAAQHRSYPKSARYGRAGIRTHDPVVGYLVWL